MKLNTFAGWAGYGLALAAFASLAGFLVAAGTGYLGWAIVAGSICVVAIALAAAIVGGTVHHDHRVHQDTPHIFEAPCVRYYTTHDTPALLARHDGRHHRTAA